MNRILTVLMVLLFLSGCALSTVKSPKKGASTPVRETEVEEEEYTPRPSILSTTSNEKEEVAPVKEKEEVLPLGSTGSEEIK